MKTIELTDREQTILICLIGMERIKKEQENWKLDGKTERLTDEEIEKYDRNSAVLLELSALDKKLND